MKTTHLRSAADLSFSFRMSGLIAGFALLSSSALAQTTWHVDDNAPGDPGVSNPFISDPLEDGTAMHPFDRIQEAINFAADGDTVLVQSGIYFDFTTLDLSAGTGKGLHIRSANGPLTTTIDGSTINDQVVAAISGETADTIFEGFTVTGGSAVGSGSNDRGGGLVIISSTVRVKNCVFTGNTAEYGGGVYTTSSNTTFENVTFRSNTAENGGGAYFNGGNIQLSGCVFEGNSASLLGGGISGVNSGASITQCDFVENVSGSGGGGAYLSASSGSSEVIEISRTRFFSNSGFYGGALVTSNNLLVADNLLFANNESTGNVQSGMYYVGTDSRFELYNSTFVHGATNAVSIIGAAQDGSVMYNCILWTDSSTAQVATNSPVSVTHCNVRGGMAGTGNIDIDPIFVNALGIDGTPGTVDDNLRLMKNSPCIDAANARVLVLNLPGDDSPVDLGGAPRVQNVFSIPDTGVKALGQALDMGCFEVPAECIRKVGFSQVP